MIENYEFKPGAIIWEMNYKGIPLIEAILESDFGLLGCVFLEYEEPDAYETLRCLGFNPNDTRTCINRKRS